MTLKPYHTENKVKDFCPISSVHYTIYNLQYLEQNNFSQKSIEVLLKNKLNVNAKKQDKNRGDVQLLTYLVEWLATTIKDNSEIEEGIARVKWLIKEGASPCLEDPKFNRDLINHVLWIAQEGKTYNETPVNKTFCKDLADVLYHYAKCHGLDEMTALSKKVFNYLKDLPKRL